MTYEEQKRIYEEAPRVSRREHYEAEKELKASLDKEAERLGLSDRYIQIYDTACMAPIQMGVNWSAIGTVDAETTIKFAELLKTAADLAEGFKFNGYVVDYSEA